MKTQTVQLNAGTRDKISQIMTAVYIGTYHHREPMPRGKAIDSITAILKGIGWRAPRKTATDLIRGRWNLPQNTILKMMRCRKHHALAS